MAWTNITINTSWQDLAIAQEIAAAYNNRALMLGLTTVTPSAAMRVHDFVHTIQTGLAAQAMWENAVDPDSAFTGLTPSSGVITYPSCYASFSAVLSQAGISSGFRRVPPANAKPADWTNDADASYAFGAVQDKDMAGPWLFRDLQRVLTALTSYKFTCSPVDGERMTLSEGSGASPLPDYPTGAISYAAEASAYFSRHSGYYVGSSYFIWSSSHDRFALHCSKSGGLGTGTKSVSFIGNVTKINSSYTFLAGLYGAESENSTLIDSVAGTTLADPKSSMLGGSQIASWPAWYDTRPSYPANLTAYSAQVGNLISLIVFSN